MSRAAPLLAACVLFVGACGGGRDDAGGGGEREARSDPFEVVERDRAKEAPGVRAAPRWEAVTTLRGSGPARHDVSIAPRAIQWRAKWTCRRGDLRVVTRQRDEPSQLLRSRCPASGDASSVTTGPVTLDVTADGPWRLAVEQQVDTPISEPPLPSMRDGDASRVARGDFYDLERRSRGAANLYRLPGGRLALRLERFRTAASADLFVWVGRSPRPRTSRQALTAPHVEIGPLKATAGSQNYILPRRVTRADVGSVIIWCEPIRIAYAAASLRPASS